MSDDSRIMQLAEEVLDSKRSLADVCVEFPELLAEVRLRLRACQRIESELDAMFPPEGMSSGAQTVAAHVATALPEIPGYQVESLLGHGGMGVVFKARHLKLNRSVAIKMLLSGAFAGRMELSRFMREAEAVASLRHAHIVQLYDIGDLEGRPYFTMEFVEGGNLAEKLAGMPRPPRQAAAMLTTLAGAIAAAHRGGIVHRDLKPANILLTIEGSPKISDFGLAGRFEGGALLTGSGTKLGTPSYMAPEQALGKADTVGPAADIYSLGAILYEMLTGRPPFKGETALETERQLIAQDPTRPSKLNRSIPRDLEMICLKCLHKDPTRRYETATALADDIQRFQRGETVTARPAGRLERGAKWVRRRPATATVLAASLLLAIASAGSALWLISQRQAIRHAVEGDLGDVERLQRRSAWIEASTALERARARSGTQDIGNLRQRLDQADRDLKLVAELDAIRLDRVISIAGRISSRKAEVDYAIAFQKEGLAELSEDPAAVAKRVTASNIRSALVSGFDDWTICTSDRSRLVWLTDVAGLSDSASAEWRHRMRSWGPLDRAKMTELTRTAPVTGESLSHLLALGRRLHDAGGDAIPFLTSIQQHHPDDFWANLVLGEVLRSTNSRESVRYLQAAMAIRPGASLVYNDLGGALWVTDRMEEALAYYRRAAELDPKAAAAQGNVCMVLQYRGRHAEAVNEFVRAIALDPENPRVHAMYGDSLAALGRTDDAIAQYQKCLTLDPNVPEGQRGLRAAFIRQGRAEEARIAWKKALDLNPPEHEAWDGYAELCLFLGNHDEYRRTCRILLEKFGNTTDANIAERTGRACLFMPGSDKDLEKAADLIDRAVRTPKSKVPTWSAPYFQFANGLAEYRKGRMETAISMEGKASTVMGPAPKLIIALARQRLGQTKEARHTLATAIQMFNWSASNAGEREAWIYHVLRREAESAILPHLAEFLEGKRQPEDDDERLALLGVCEFKDLRVAKARLYADIMMKSIAVTAPESLDAIPGPVRHRAACAAGAAGCGRGADASQLDDAERLSWRTRARDWLQADLSAWRIRVDADARARRPMQEALADWRTDPDLSGLRDAEAINKLSADERDECVKLWAE